MRRKLELLFELMAVTAFFFLPTGCEDEPAMEDADAYFANHPYTDQPREPGYLTLMIEPNQDVVITMVGQRITFRAKGGEPPYRWVAGIKDRCKLLTSGVENDTATYIAKVLLPNSLTAYDNNGRAATVQIRALEAAPLTIIPSAVILSDNWAGERIQFNVYGGYPPYGKWTASRPDLGTIDPVTGLYTATSDTSRKGENRISITDSIGTVKTATVTHN
ncbi:MAG: hypothetical protein N2255_00095 [Kiritimatiellae bacterium]|nr:hypothetical protein [Kiritimatiellia bacterium]